MQNLTRRWRYKKRFKLFNRFQRPSRRAAGSLRRGRCPSRRAAWSLRGGRAHRGAPQGRSAEAEPVEARRRVASRRISNISETKMVGFCEKPTIFVSLRGRSAAVAILKPKVWHSVAKHGSTKQEEIPIIKTWDSLLCFASSLFISRFCFVPLNHSSLRDDKSFR